MSSKIAIYTSIFGGYDDLPKISFKPKNCDFLCFTEDNIKSTDWNVIHSPIIYKDSNRNAKRFKILPHKYLSDYDYSIWIDGNMDVVGDVNKLIEQYLKDASIAFYSHNNNKLDPRNCPYEEANKILELGSINMQRWPERGILNYKDNPKVITKQMQNYHYSGFPHNNGLITGMVILRKHNHLDCIKVMEQWWSEISYNSKRDQLSFNYSAWKQDIKFNYISGDSRNNEYFYRSTKPHKGKK